MSLTVEGGKLVVRNSALGTMQSCCCQSGDNVAPCTCFNPSNGRSYGVTQDFGGGDVYVTVTSTCFGSGAVGKADTLGTVNPCSDAALGGLRTVSITNPGSGYAKKHRVAPTITASAAGGADADFNVSLLETPGTCGVPTWSVSGVAVVDGGTGYTDDTLITFYAADGDTTEAAATARGFVRIDEPQPTISIASTNGTGAVLEAVWELLPEDDWADFLDVERGDICDGPPKKTYRLAGFTVIDGGQDYEQFDVITLSFDSAADGAVLTAAYADVDVVDESGAITDLFVGSPSFTPGPFGRYIGSESGVLTSVVVYKITDGSPACNTASGVYYREDNGTPYVSPITVVVDQEDPETGSGAVVTATIDVDPTSGTFGQIVAMTVVSPGVAYLDVVACALPENAYVTFGDTTLEVPFSGLGVTSPYDVCESGELVVGETKSSGYFFAVLLGCLCDDEIHLRVEWTGECVRGVAVPGFPDVAASELVYRSKTISCWKFPTNDDCPSTEAVLVASFGELTCFDGPIENCPCANTDCFNFGIPIVSLMPP